MCLEKDRLTAEYHAATEIFSRSVTDLHDKMGMSSKVEYERLQRASEGGFDRNRRDWHLNNTSSHTPVEFLGLASLARGAASPT